MEIISGRDELDATSTPEEVSDYSGGVAKIKDISGLKVGLPKEYFLKELDKEVRDSILAVAKKLEDAGAEIKEVSLPYTKYGISVYYIVTPSELSSNLARFDGIGWGLNKEGTKDLQDFYKTNRGEGFGAETKRRIMLGTYALSAGYYDAYYKKAQAVRTLIIEDFKKAFEKVDILLTPTSPHPAFKVGEKVNNPLAMYLEDVFLVGANLAGLAAISIPAGMLKAPDNKNISLPIGAHLIAPRLAEELLLNISGFLEK